MPSEMDEEDVANFASFCVDRQYADALDWMVLRGGVQKLGFVPFSVDTAGFLWLMAWVDRLPRAMRLDMSSQMIDFTDDAVIDALALSRNLVGISTYNCFSDQPLDYCLEKLASNTVLTELEMSLQCKEDVIAMNRYVRENRTLDSLSIRCIEDAIDPDFEDRLDLASGMLANNSLKRIALYGWHIDEDLVQALVKREVPLLSIHFEICEFTPEAIKLLAAAIASDHAPRSLQLARIRLTNAETSRNEADGETAVAAALRTNHTVETLDFGVRKLPERVLTKMQKVLKDNTTLLNFSHNVRTDKSCRNLMDHECYEAAVEIERRLLENREVAKFPKHYPLAEEAFVILPGVGLPALPLDVSQTIVRMLPRMGPSGLDTYRILHRLTAHKRSQARATPPFPPGLDLAMEPLALQLARQGRKALPMPPAILDRVVAFCIGHQAGEALDWMVVHAPLTELRLGQGANTEEELRWLMKWTRSAPSPLKLRLDGSTLSGDMIAILARQLRHHPIVTALSLRRCAIAPGHLSVLLRAIRFNTALRELALPAELWSTRVHQAIEDLLCHNRSLNLIEIGTGHCFGPGLDIAGQGSKVC